ncbi:MAG: hypothetical protein JWM17_1833 [Actinobacteria bacterium]|nr:hypothetical protein [Actinomycetota bacterium]MEA2588934.1 hypothetical protein [Actinomycetota bacterium]
MSPTSRDPTGPTTKCGMSAVMQAILRTVAFYTFAGWSYIVLNAIVHPVTLHLPLTHFAPWPHEDTFGALCFLASFSSALVWQILKSRNT